MMTTCVEGGTFRWMSPELLDPESFGLEESRPTKESDCYALGMVIYEVLSGQVPFALKTSPVVIRMVLEGKRPERPQGGEGGRFTDAIWGLLELCWKPQASDRARVETVHRTLESCPSSEPQHKEPRNPAPSTHFSLNTEPRTHGLNPPRDIPRPGPPTKATHGNGVPVTPNPPKAVPPLGGNPPAEKGSSKKKQCWFKRIFCGCF